MDREKTLNAPLGQHESGPRTVVLDLIQLKGAMTDGVHL